MAPESHSSNAIPFSLEVYTLYAALLGAPESVRVADPHREPDLGGQLVWCGELDAMGRMMTIAGSVAGAATLAATADARLEKQAIREGVVNFLVTSLDEALRILKNEIRKREPVAVCVGAPLASVESEMAERGVRPDLTRKSVLAATSLRREQGDARDPMKALVSWRVDGAPAVWLPRLDAIALDCVDPEDHAARRWIGRAGRYLGRLGHDGHGLWIDRAFGVRLIERIREQSERGEIKVRGRVEVVDAGGSDQFPFGDQLA